MTGQITLYPRPEGRGFTVRFGKVVSYPKCIKKDATPAEKQKALNLIKKAKQHGVNVNVPAEIPECPE